MSHDAAWRDSWLCRSRDRSWRWLWRLVRRNAEVENLRDENYRFDEIGMLLLSSAGEAGLDYFVDKETKSGLSTDKTEKARLLKDSGSKPDNFLATANTRQRVVEISPHLLTGIARTAERQR